MAITDAIVQELDQEGATSRRVLERVPEDKLSWKPHAKSMSLGQLALHVAYSPGFLASWALNDAVDLTGMGEQAQATSRQEILAAHDASQIKAKDVVRTLGDAGLQASWKATAGGATLMEMPKAALFRTVVLNHGYHHRGQLSVYLRLLDVPVPSIYGPSADENRFTPR